MSSTMKLTSSASFSPSIRISLRLKIHQAQAKNFCRVLDIRVAQRMERVIAHTAGTQQTLEVLVHGLVVECAAKFIGENQIERIVPQRSGG